MRCARMATVALVFVGIFFAGSQAGACTVCHSKDPKMAKMHVELEYKDCFTCHRFEKRRSPEEQKRQQENDARCTRCHRKDPSPDRSGQQE